MLGGPPNQPLRYNPVSHGATAGRAAAPGERPTFCHLLAVGLVEAAHRQERRAQLDLAGATADASTKIGAAVPTQGTTAAG